MMTITATTSSIYDTQKMYTHTHTHTHAHKQTYIQTHKQTHTQTHIQDETGSISGTALPFTQTGM